jgi:hypothetical protein
VEHGAPLLESDVGRDDHRFGLVAQADDAEEQVCGAAVARDVAELVDQEKVGRGVAAQPSLGGGMDSSWLCGL